MKMMILTLQRLQY